MILPIYEYDVYYGCLKVVDTGKYIFTTGMLLHILQKQSGSVWQNSLTSV